MGEVKGLLEGELVQDEEPFDGSLAVDSVTLIWPRDVALVWPMLRRAGVFMSV